jgi:hypothetical protein
MTKCRFYNECKRLTTIMGPICGYYNECKKTNDYYWVLQLMQKISDYYGTYMRVL